MNINLSAVLIVALGLIILSVVVIAIAVGVFCLVRAFLKLKKLHHRQSIVYFFLMIATVIIMMASWFLNFGWLRLFLTWIPLPIIHILAFLIINSIILQKLSLSVKLKIYTAMSYVTFLLSYFLFPDGGDVGGMYFFFTLIRNDMLVDIAFALCGVSLVTHIIFTVLQIIEYCKVKKQIQ